MGGKKLQRETNVFRQRVLLTDRQCQLFLNDMKEFGYQSLSFEKVREIANQVHAGADLSGNVIAAFMVKMIDDAVQT